MMKKLLLVALLLPTSVLAEVKTFQWVAPTEYTDDSPLPISEIDNFNIKCDNGGVVIVAQPANTDVEYDVDFSPGSYVCHMTTVAGGIESKPSDTVSFTIDGDPVTKEPAVIIQFRVKE